MAGYNNLLPNVFKILPDYFDCLIQAPALEDIAIKDLMSSSDWPYYQLIKVTQNNKADLINVFSHNHSIQYFNNVQLIVGSNLLFEGFDGIEYGQISKNIVLPEWFVERYIATGACLLSTEW